MTEKIECLGVGNGFKKQNGDIFNIEINRPFEVIYINCKDMLKQTYLFMKKNDIAKYFKINIALVNESFGSAIYLPGDAFILRCYKQPNYTVYYKMSVHALETLADVSRILEISERKLKAVIEHLDADEGVTF